MIKFTATPDQSRKAAEIVETMEIAGVTVGKTQVKFVPVDGATKQTTVESATAFLHGVESAKADATGRQTALASLIRKTNEAIATLNAEQVAEVVETQATVVTAKPKAKKATARDAARAAAAKPKAKATKPTPKPKADGAGPVGGHSIDRKRGTGSIWVRNTGKKRFLTAVSIRGQRRRMLFATQAEAEQWLDEMVAA